MLQFLSCCDQFTLNHINVFDLEVALFRLLLIINFQSFDHILLDHLFGNLLRLLERCRRRHNQLLRLRLLYDWRRLLRLNLARL